MCQRYDSRGLQKSASGWSKSERVTGGYFFIDRKINLSKKWFFGCRIATNDNWAMNWLCAKNTSQVDNKNQFPVGQSPNSSRGDNFLEIEKTEKSIYQKSNFWM